MPEENADDILNSEETAAILGITRQYLYLFVFNKEIQPEKPPEDTIMKKPRLKFKRSEVMRFKQAKKQLPAAAA